MVKKKIKVLHIIYSFGVGGAETWLIHLLRYWGVEGEVQCDFLITSGEKDFFDADAEKLGAKLYYAPLNFKKTGSFISRFRTILKEHKYDAIHDHQDILSGWHFLFGIGKLPRVRIAHVHNPTYQLLENYGSIGRRRIQLKIGKVLLRWLATHFVGTSLQVLEEYGLTRSLYKKQWIGSLYCSFPIENYKGCYSGHKQWLCDQLNWPLNTKIVLFVGRLDYALNEHHPQNHKNSVFALNVFEKIEDKNIRMVMAGANEYIYDRFTRLIKDKNLSERVKLLGLRKDVNKLMLGSDLLFFPSRAEGLGMVAVEAQAAGLPVLASTAVPKECVVIEEIVKFMPLSESHIKWANSIEAIIENERGNSTHDDPRWQNSEFNIQAATKKMIDIYKDEAELSVNPSVSANQFKA